MKKKYFLNYLYRSIHRSHVKMTIIIIHHTTDQPHFLINKVITNITYSLLNIYMYIYILNVLGISILISINNNNNACIKKKKLYIRFT